MQTASLSDIQAPNVASLTDIQPAAQAGTASVADIQSVNVASVSDIDSNPPHPAPAAPTGEIKSWTPSVWDRIKAVFIQGSPNYSTRTVNDPNYGQMQILSPAEAMTPEEQRQHPVLTGLGEVAGGLTSPESVALLAGTGGLGELPGAAAMIPRLLSAGFGTQAIYQAAQKYPEIKAAIARGDTPETERLLTHAVLDVGMAALAARHASGGGAVTGKAEVEAPAPIETHASTSPVGELLNDPAPDVRATDSSTAKDHLVNQDTIHPGSNAEAAVRSSPDVAPLRTARIVSDSHLPVVSRNEVLAEAMQNMVNNSGELGKLGLDPAKINSPADAEAMLQQAADHIRTNLDPRANVTIGFDVQKQLASELGMTVEDLLSRKSGGAFNAEQAIAARALLNDSGLAVVKAARFAVADKSALPDMVNALSQHQSILDAVKGMSAESGRALGSFNIQDLPASRIADAMSKLNPEAQGEAAELLAKIDPSNKAALNDFIEKITPSTTADQVFEFYRNALLSGPATVIKKGVSEATMLALETAKKLAAAGLSKLKGSDDQRYAGEAYWFAKGSMDAMAHAKSVLSGEFNLEDAPGFEKTGQQAIKGVAGSIIRFPSVVLSKQTNMMYVLNYLGELNSQAVRVAINEGLSGTELAARQEYLVQHPSKEMTDAAHDTALHNTFQREVGKFGMKVQSAIKSDPTGLLKYLVPFYRTPINLVKESAYYSPYGLLKGRLTGDLDMQARGLVGSSLAGLIALLTVQGHVTGGGPVDLKKRNTLESTGWQPYSIKIGDRYFSYRRAEPVGLAMALVADAVHSVHSGDPEVVSQSKVDNAVNHIARNLQDVAFIPTLASLSEAISNPGARVNNFISRQIASFIPAVVKDVAQTVDPTVRKPVGITQTIESRIPGLTTNVPAVIGPDGKPVRHPAAVGGANPFPVSTANHDPVLSELARLGISTGQAPNSIKRHGKITELSDTERQKLTEQESQALYEKLGRIVTGRAWQNIPDDIKRKRISGWKKEIEETRPVRLTRLQSQ